MNRVKTGIIIVLKTNLFGNKGFLATIQRIQGGSIVGGTLQAILLIVFSPEFDIGHN